MSCEHSETCEDCISPADHMEMVRRWVNENAELRKALAQAGEELQRGVDALAKAYHERGQFHTERDEQRNRAVAAEQRELEYRSLLVRIANHEFAGTVPGWCRDLLAKLPVPGVKEGG